MIFGRTLVAFVLALAPLVSANPLPEDASPAVDDSLLKSSTYNCPATNNGPGRNYPAHSYTSGQVNKAYKTARDFQQKKGESWKPGRTDYPHFFGNNEKLPFDCGKNKAEFPILIDNQVFTPPSGNVANVPDRVVYEYSWKKKGNKNVLTTKVCGVMRHGPAAPFLNCPKK